MSLFKPRTGINTNMMSFSEFIEIHRMLEDAGETMLYTTQQRLNVGEFNYKYLYFGDGKWQGADYDTSLIDIFTKNNIMRVIQDNTVQFIYNSSHKSDLIYKEQSSNLKYEL